MNERIPDSSAFALNLTINMLHAYAARSIDMTELSAAREILQAHAATARDYHAPEYVVQFGYALSGLLRATQVAMYGRSLEDRERIINQAIADLPKLPQPWCRKLADVAKLARRRLVEDPQPTQVSA